MGEVRMEGEHAEAIMSAVLVLRDLVRIPRDQRLDSRNSTSGKKAIDIDDGP
jgi:hypothetical protein